MTNKVNCLFRYARQKLNVPTNTLVPPALIQNLDIMAFVVILMAYGIYHYRKVDKRCL